MALVCNFRSRQKLRIPVTTVTAQRFCCDEETGELVAYRVNNETGEPSMESQSPPIMSSSAGNSVTSSMKYRCMPLSKRKKLQALKASIKAGSNTTSYRMLLFFPTLLMFPSLICVMLIILEIYLHVLCHKNNKKLANPNLYYRSPFHVVTSIFCGLCRECDMASKVGQLQDKRRHHYDYLRRITI